MGLAGSWLQANEYEHSKPNTNSGPEKYPSREMLYHSTQPFILPNLLGWGSAATGTLRGTILMVSEMNGTRGKLHIRIPTIIAIE